MKMLFYIFPDDVNVFVATDDVAWCKEQEFFQGDRFLLNENVERYEHKCMEGDGQYRNSSIPYTDLCLMSLCNGAIISPSSLSGGERGCKPKKNDLLLHRTLGLDQVWQRVMTLKT